MEVIVDYHIPVLLKESIEGLNIDPQGTYVDVTFGGGGHSCQILKKLKTGKLIAFDKDPDTNPLLISDPKFTFIRHDFKFIKNYLGHLNVLPVNGILADLGVSSHQFDTRERGFSYRFDANLDMRMDPDIEVSAQDIVNTYSEEELHRILGMYGEIKNAKTLASRIVKARAEAEIKTTGNLVDIINGCVMRGDDRKKYTGQVFQALRITVNDELNSLKKLMESASEILAPGGRLVVITYHSLEDRIVKNYIKSGNFTGIAETDMYGNLQGPFKMINRKPIEPTEKEIGDNIRARSAKLRIAEKL
jgi:16S rRNA (cytosine1402-N4)-methyltransferase